MKFVKKHTDKIRKNKILDITIIAIFFVFIFSFLYFTGTATSGYHLIDDHSMISIKETLNQESFLQTNIKYVKGDLNIRFRPLYYVYYISETKMFGVNFFRLSFFTGIMAFFSFIFFYLGMRKLKHSIVNSFLFVLMIFVGSQMAIWWRLGTNETIGMFFLGLSFLFMAKCLEKEKYKTNTVVFIIFLIIASLCKESFIIIIPAFVTYKIWNEKNIFSITIKESIKNNYLLAVPLVIMFIELAVIKFVVGTNKIGYAGLTASINEFILGVKNILLNKTSLLPWIKFLGEMLGIYLISLFFIKKEKIIWSTVSLSSELIFSLLIVLPNIFMYAKSGMTERYLLPATLGLSFLAISILKNTKQFFSKIVMYVVIFLFVLSAFNLAKTSAINFANEGKSTNILFSTIKNNAKFGSKILLVVDPVDRYEVSYSIKTYLAFFGFKNLYAYPVARKYNNDFERGLLIQWHKWFNGKKIEDINGHPDLIIIFDKSQLGRFFSENKNMRVNYEKISSDNARYIIYLKKR